MAFNPFISFRKYQRFWMATVLLLTMVTFVLCTGVGGDLSQRLLELFHGPDRNPLARIDGHNVSSKDLSDLKDQRNMANEFVKRALELAINRINALEQSQKLTPEQRQKELPKLLQAKADLERRYRKQRYFGTGVKLDELVDFKVWLHQADRLGVNLLPDNVKNLLNVEMQLAIFNPANPELLYTIMRELRATAQRSPTEASIVKALNDEFRVRIAQTALEYSDRYALHRSKAEKLEMESLKEVRIPLSPAMLWDAFKADRSTFDVALVPVAVEDFVNQGPEPTEAELKSLFDAHAKQRYDPASPTPGFEVPTSTRVGLVIGDPDSPKFKLWSKAATLMEATPPACIPYSPWTMLGRYIGGPLAQRAMLEGTYENIQRSRSNLRGQYLTAAWNEADVYLAMAAKLADPYPEAAASWIAGYAQPTNWATAQLGFDAFGIARHSQELKLGVADEAKARSPVYATVVFSGATGSGLAAYEMLQTLNKEKFFPLDVVLQPLTQALEHRQAQTWVNVNMNLLRKKLDGFVGNPKQYERYFRNSFAQLGLEYRETKDFYNRFTIAKAPELEPLHKAFESRYVEINNDEGRNLNPDSLLKEGDFYKLFFDNTETLSVAGATFKAKPWPPMVTPKKAFLDKEASKGPQTVDLFETAERPILFWKIMDKAGRIPAFTDAGMRERVEQAWKFSKAEETKALPKAKAIAEALQKSEVGVGPALQIAAAELKKDIINLKGLAPLYTDIEAQRVLPGMPRAFESGERDYTAYQLPKNTFVYPRDDMAKELLSLRDLKKPLETGIAKLDAINGELLRDSAKTGQIVQILTNKPHSVFYVACVTFNPGPSMTEFRSVLKYAARTESFRGGTYVDYFFDHAFEEAGKQYQQALMDQLRAETDTTVSATAEERKTFDANEAL